MRKTASLLAAIASLAVCATAFAQGTSGVPSYAQGQGGQEQHGQGPGGPGESGGRRGPPPEAISACSGKSLGAACSFTGRRGETISGTCRQPPSGGQGQAAACVPKDMPPGGQQGGSHQGGMQNGMPPGGY